MRRCFLFFITIIFSYTIYGIDDCSNVDLRKKQFKNIPITKQNFGTCYAYTAAQLIDAQFAEEGRYEPTHRTFPLPSLYLGHDTWYNNLWALLEPNRRIYQFMNGGFTCNTANAMIKYGSCNYNKMLETLKKTAYGKNMKTIEEEGAILQYLEAIEKILGFIQVQAEEQHCTENCFLKNLPEKKFELRRIFGPGYNEILKVLKGSIENENLFAFTGHFMYKQCQAYKKMLKDVECVTNDDLNKEIRIKNLFKGTEKRKKKIPELSPIDVVHQRLNQEKPVAIKYCKYMLDAGKNFVGVNHFGLPKIGENGCGTHASVVIGRRKKNGTCQLLIRNSYGKKCTYSSDWECKDGEIWVDEDALIQNIVSSSFIRKK